MSPETQVRIPRRKPRTAHIGVFGVGHQTYWSQFDGLLDELQGKLEVFVKRVETRGVRVTNFGMVDCAQAAYALLPRLQAADLDLVFCDMLTYATSATFGVLVRSLDVPVVLVALQPLKAMESILPVMVELGAIRKEHPATFPVGLPLEYIRAMSNPGDVVIEPFAGSGTTVIACEQTHRKCCAMELDPKYCDVIRRRWAEFTHGEGCDWKALTPEITNDKEDDDNA